MIEGILAENIAAVHQDSQRNSRSSASPMLYATPFSAAILVLFVHWIRERIAVFFRKHSTDCFKSCFLVVVEADEGSSRKVSVTQYIGSEKGPVGIIANKPYRTSPISQTTSV
jgi:hypothetical protein